MDRYFAKEFTPGKWHICDRRNRNLPIPEGTAGSGEKSQVFHEDEIMETVDRLNDAARADAPELCGRCLFRNRCLSVHCYSLPGGPDLAACFAGRQGVLTVSQGQLQIEAGGHCRTLREGDSWLLLPAVPTAIWANQETDVVFAERLPAD